MSELKYPIDMEYVGPLDDFKGAVVRFDSLKVGEVIIGSNSKEYPIGYHSTNWVGCTGVEYWKEYKKIYMLPDDLFEI